MSAQPKSSWLAPFQVRSFRFQWPADLLTSWAFEMETLILGWYILVETGSVLALTVFGALQYIGTLLAPVLGMVGDRIGHRNLLALMRVAYCAIAITLLSLAGSGLLTPAAVFVLAGLLGLLRPFDLGVRSALIAQTMPSDILMGAMSISRTTMDSARVAGAITGAGLFAALGIAPAYLLVTACYALGLLLTLGIARPAPRVDVEATVQPDPTSPLRDLKEGMSYVWSRPWLRGAMMLAFLVNLTAFPLSNGLLPYVARDVYGIDQTGLGYLVASFAAGALVGSIALSRMGTTQALGRMMLVSAVLWYLLLLCFAQMRTFMGGTAFLFLAGLAQSCSMISLAVMILRTSAPQLRGRVMGVRMLAIYSLPLGLLGAGALIGRYGFQSTATAYAIFGLIGTMAIALTWRSALWQAHSVANRG